MDAGMQQKAAEVVRKIQSDPVLLKEFENAPAKTIEKVAGINIPDFRPSCRVCPILPKPPECPLRITLKP